MKKLIGFVLGLALAVSSVSALEFSVGAKANADYSIITIENGEVEMGSTFGAGDAFDWGIGLGYFTVTPDYIPILPACFDIYADINCGPGKILIDVAADGFFGTMIPYRFDFGVGYLYTF